MEYAFLIFLTVIEYELSCRKITNCCFKIYIIPIFNTYVEMFFLFTCII